jgi:type 1 glutamine amidotransferase
VSEVIAMSTALLLLILAAPVNPYDQSGVPIEVDTHDPKLAKIVLVAGSPSHPPGAHEYLATQAILKGLLEQTPGVFAVIVRDSWPRDPKIFDRARAIVWYTDGAKNHPLLKPERAAELQRRLDGGVGFVAFHYAVNTPKELVARGMSWWGGTFDPDMSGGTGAIKWTPKFTALPRHPVTRGVKPFAINDEWYFDMHFVPGAKGITPVIQAAPPEDLRARSPDARKYPGRPETLAWTYDRPDGGRSFAITTPHSHADWSDENFRKLVVNAILWTAKLEVPKDGAKVTLDPADLQKNLDDKRPRPDGGVK